MKTKILVLSLMFAVSFGFAQTKKMHFETTTFAEIKAKAKKENKLIFIDAYTSWCGPCKWMAANVFTNDTVADYFNAKFINAKFDMEIGEGVDIAKLYEVQCYPNLLFIDGDGKLIHRGAGGLNVKKFTQLAEDTFNPEKRFSKYKSRRSGKSARMNETQVSDKDRAEEEAKMEASLHEAVIADEKKKAAKAVAAPAPAPEAAPQL